MKIKLGQEVLVQHDLYGSVRGTVVQLYRRGYVAVKIPQQREPVHTHSASLHYATPQEVSNDD